MADDCLCRWDLSGTALLALFDASCPQKHSWQLCHLRPQMQSVLTSCLSRRHSSPQSLDHALWEPRAPGANGRNSATASSRIPGSKAPSTLSSCSKSLPNAHATVVPRKTATMSSPAQFQLPSVRLARRLPAWGPGPTPELLWPAGFLPGPPGQILCQKGRSSVPHATRACSTPAPPRSPGAEPRPPLSSHFRHDGFGVLLHHAFWQVLHQHRQIPPLLLAGCLVLPRLPLAPHDCPQRALRQLCCVHLHHPKTFREGRTHRSRPLRQLCPVSGSLCRPPRHLPAHSRHHS